MDSQEIQDLVKLQNSYFQSGETLNYEFRKKALEKLKKTIHKYEAEIYNALKKDLYKSRYESYSTEIGIIYEEITYTLKKLKKWMAPERKKTPLFLFPGKSELRSDPYGTVLIIGPWNYPFQLIFGPLIGAIAAGKTAFLKNSEHSPATGKIITKIVEEAFEKKFICSVEGAIEEAQYLLEQRFDFIFFTGSTHVGRIVAKAAAEHMTPTCLELGGKSPCLIDKETNLVKALKRVVWGKYLNAGQTCIAPDYLLIPEGSEEEVIAIIKKHLVEFFGENPIDSDSFGRIINERNFDRLTSLIDTAKVKIGGDSQKDQKYIAPTIMMNVSWDDPIMRDEIFGPILPVLSYKSIDQIVDQLKTFEKPLALYMFSDNDENIENVLTNLSFGGGCINDTVVHIANGNLPFGGVGSSGTGAYHGHHSFKTFSHAKSVFLGSTAIDFKERYAPFNEKKLNFIKRFFS